MNKIPYKVRVGLGADLFLWSVGAVIATIIFSQQGLGVWVLIVGPTLAVISFVIFVIIMSKTNEDGSPIVIKKKPKANKQNRKKERKQFISDEELNKFEEEDDECFFIEEHVEDD